jgi:hypothetical protein
VLIELSYHEDLQEFGYVRQRGTAVRPESPPESPPLDPEDDADPPALYPEDETDPPPEDVDPIVLLVAAPEDEVAARGSDSRWRTRVYPTPSIAWPAPLGLGLSERPPSTTTYEELNAYG